MIQIRFRCRCLRTQGAREPGSQGSLGQHRAGLADRDEEPDDPRRSAEGGDGPGQYRRGVDYLVARILQGVGDNEAQTVSGHVPPDVVGQARQRILIRFDHPAVKLRCRLSHPESNRPHRPAAGFGSGVVKFRA